VPVSPEGTRAYIVGAVNDSVSVINTRTGHLTATIHVSGYPQEVAVSPNGTHIYVADFQVVVAACAHIRIVIAA
jgi:YVTN family beta-propeller protein